jgi:hypothetical protein
MKYPELIEFPPKGTNDLGFLSVAESMKSIPFEVKRVFWLYDLPGDIERGNHAHRDTEQILICIKGVVEFFAEMPDRSEFNFTICDPSVGIYIPACAWHYMKYKEGTVQLVLASTHYSEDDYFREYEDFNRYYR